MPRFSNSRRQENCHREGNGQRATVRLVNQLANPKAEADQSANLRRAYPRDSEQFMPQTQSWQEYYPAQTVTGPIRAVREEPPPPNPNRPPPAWAIVAGVVIVAAVIAAVTVYVRRAAYRAWRAFAAGIGGEFRPADAFSPHAVSGEIRGRPYLLETGTSHEDDAPYYHTRGRAPIKNVGSFIMGLRRKSLLESAQTVRDKPPYELGDPEFERSFFLYCNDPENLAAVLSPEIRRELGRYHDVEVYVRMGEMEWRRAGEQGDLNAIRRLTDALLAMAAAIDQLPARSRSLTQVLADERMIEKGV